MKWKQDFFVGYSPERINPGDREHTLTRIVKVVSGDTPATLERVARIYELVITAGVHRASSINVAEAAKVIENTQRDLNIALMNELALIFHRIGIDTLDVLQAAGTKWNFLPFRPGLVGGHCIGVDPYYLTHKADKLGYHPQVILAGRRINDGMGKYVAEQTVKQLIQSGAHVKGAEVIVLGLTFKENCPDLRNSRVIDIMRELESYGARVSVHDPLADAQEAMHEYGVALRSWDELPRASAIVAAVAHDEFKRRPIDDFARQAAARRGLSSTSSARPIRSSCRREGCGCGGCRDFLVSRGTSFPDAAPLRLGNNCLARRTGRCAIPGQRPGEGDDRAGEAVHRRHRHVPDDPRAPVPVPGYGFRRSGMGRLRPRMPMSLPATLEPGADPEVLVALLPGAEPSRVGVRKLSRVGGRRRARRRVAENGRASASAPQAARFGDAWPRATACSSPAFRSAACLGCSRRPIGRWWRRLPRSPCRQPTGRQLDPKVVRRIRDAVVFGVPARCNGLSRQQRQPAL